jgi:hypothetical protein
MLAPATGSQLMTFDFLLFLLDLHLAFFTAAPHCHLIFRFAKI